MPSADTRLDPAHANSAGSLITGCVVCESRKAPLSRCAGCRLVSYCGIDHQTIDWPSHKASCNRVKRELRRVDREERDLREKSAVGNLFLPQNVFETHAGYFWGIMDTRTYMRALVSVMEAQINMKTELAVQAGRDTCMEMHRLCRSDNQGIRYITPVQMLRLGKDQECYDFLKWYATTSQDPHYNWGNLDAPYLDIKDANVFESI